MSGLSKRLRIVGEIGKITGNFLIFVFLMLVKLSYACSEEQHICQSRRWNALAVSLFWQPWIGGSGDNKKNHSYYIWNWNCAIAKFLSKCFKTTRTLLDGLPQLSVHVSLLLPLLTLTKTSLFYLYFIPILLLSYLF